MSILPSHNFIYLNGEFVDGNHPTLHIDNAMFQLGDGTYDDVLAYGTEAKHLAQHIKLLKSNLKLINIESPFILEDEKNLKEVICRLLNKNRIFDNARIRITVFRGTVPTEPSICIESHKLNSSKYQFNKEGLLLGVYEEIKKPCNILSNIKGSNKLLYVKAKQYLKHNNLSNCVILNAEDRVSEVIDSNIFIIRGNKIYTPSLAEACCPNVMRNIICEVAPTLGIDIDNQVGFNTNVMINSREIFIADPIYGIRWVLGIGQQRYPNEISLKLHEAINHLTFS